MYEFRVSLLNSALKRERSPSDLNTKDNSFQDLARRVWGSLENCLLGIFGGTKECTSALLVRFKGSASSRNDSLKAGGSLLCLYLCTKETLSNLRRS